jgi:hypothetical protein
VVEEDEPMTVSEEETEEEQREKLIMRIKELEREREQEAEKYLQELETRELKKSEPPKETKELKLPQIDFNVLKRIDTLSRRQDYVQREKDDFDRLLSKWINQFKTKQQLVEAAGTLGLDTKGTIATLKARIRDTSPPVLEFKQSLKRYEKEEAEQVYEKEAKKREEEKSRKAALTKEQRLAEEYREELKRLEKQGKSKKESRAQAIVNVVAGDGAGNLTEILSEEQAKMSLKRVRDPIFREAYLKKIVLLGKALGIEGQRISVKRLAQKIIDEPAVAPVAEPVSEPVAVPVADPRAAEDTTGSGRFSKDRGFMKVALPIYLDTRNL